MSQAPSTPADTRAAGLGQHADVTYVEVESPQAGRRPDGLSHPAQVFLPDGELLSAGRQRQLLLGFLLLGLLARCVRYFLRFPLWEDECFLCVNFTERGYADLVEPLRYHQVAPPLFLWVELTAVRLLGFTELALRLFPFLCSVASLLLFRHLAGRLLRGLPLVLAVAVFAVAYPCVRYAAEAKQYASDQLVSLVLLTLLLAWWRQPAERRRARALTAFAPLAVALSYPAVFVAGGASLVMAAVLWAGRSRRGWGGWLAYNGALLCSFTVLLLTVARGQGAAELPFMDRCWQAAFPPVTSPRELPGWLLLTHTGDILAYPVGGSNGGSTLTFLCFLSGLAVLVRRRLGLLLLLCLAPFALHLAAAALERYPYGGHVKFAQPLAPLICVVSALGAAAWINRLAARPRLGRAALAAGVGVPFLIGVGCVARDLAHPYKTQSDQRARAFAQWFWPCAAFEGEAVCCKTDLGLEFSSAAYRELSWAAMYLCNQKIYSPRHAAGGPWRPERVAPGRPLRCVLYRDPDYPCDEAAVSRWLADMRARYALAGREVYPLPRFDKREVRLVKVDHLDIFTFLPRAGADGRAPLHCPVAAVPAAAVHVSRRGRL